MIDFHTTTIADKTWADKCLHQPNYPGCEYTFGNLFIWRRAFGTRIAEVGGMLAGCSETRCFYMFPAGDGDLRDTIHALRADAAERGMPFCLYGVSEFTLPLLNELFPGQFTAQPNEAWFDYIYNTSDLIELPGKKYHNKRNHIARFTDSYDYVYEPMTPGNLAECRAMCDEWYGTRDWLEFTDERAALTDAFNYFGPLGLVGGLIRAAAKGSGDAPRIVALAIGEEVNPDTFCVHFEKAFSDIQGAYPLINRDFAAHAASGYKYVNREEDMGLEGLRRAKQSYRPAMLLKKYGVKFI